MTFQDINRRVRAAHEVFLHAAHEVVDANGSRASIEALTAAKREIDAACEEAKQFLESTIPHVAHNSLMEFLAALRQAAQAAN
jgi:hypothetical protein